MKVWIVEGWFGDIEWKEGVYATEELARAEAARLNETRTSDNGPSYARGLHKFAYDQHEVIGADA